jgi:Effector protein
MSVFRVVLLFFSVCNLVSGVEREIQFRSQTGSAGVPLLSGEGPGLIVQAGAENVARFAEALDYLKQSPRARAIIQHLERQAAKPITVRVLPDNPRGNSYDTATRTVEWDPTEGLKWKRSPLHPWKKRTPALLLLHELTHAYHDDVDHARFAARSRPDHRDAQWTTAEEKDTIQEVENPAAAELGEPGRDWHDTFSTYKGQKFAARNPASTAEVQDRRFSPLPGMRAAE